MLHRCVAVSAGVLCRAVHRPVCAAVSDCVSAPFRPFSVSVPVADLSAAARADLDAAVERVGTLPAGSVDNPTLLELYGLFKQASEGDVTTSAPSIFQMKARYKWDAWKGRKGLSQDAAAAEYVAYVSRLVQAHSSSAASAAATSTSAAADEVLLLSRPVDGVLQLTLNRPSRFHALNWELFNALQEALTGAAQADDVRAVVLASSGPFFSSGNDLANFSELPITRAAAVEAQGILERFVASFIDLQKPLLVGARPFAVLCALTPAQPCARASHGDCLMCSMCFVLVRQCAVNGPAIGIGATILSHADAVVCTPNAYFNTPFTALGQSPEACSSVLFPRIMGDRVARDVLMFGRKLTAFEARDCT